MIYWGGWVKAVLHSSSDMSVELAGSFLATCWPLCVPSRVMHYVACITNWSLFRCRKHLDVKPAKLMCRWCNFDGIKDHQQMPQFGIEVIAQLYRPPRAGIDGTAVTRFVTQPHLCTETSHCNSDWKLYCFEVWKFNQTPCQCASHSHIGLGLSLPCWSWFE